MKKALVPVFCTLLASTSFLLAEKLPSYEIKLPGQPFGVVTSQDQEWIFVSLFDEKRGPGISVLRNKDGRLEMVRTVPTLRIPSGIVLTHQGDMLIAAAQELVIFLDTERLKKGESEPSFQWVSDGRKAGSVYVNVTADDKTLFVSDELQQMITVMDLDHIRSLGRDSVANKKNFAAPEGARKAIVGRIPVGLSPVALAFSKDGRWLFSTSQIASPDWGWPRILEPEDKNLGPEKVSEGAIVVIDVTKAKTDPKGSVVAKVPAGGSPVRLALSPDGNRLFVAARNNDVVLVFDTAQLIKDAAHVKPTVIPVAADPVPIIVTASGKLAVVGNSYRYGNDPANLSFLTLLDTTRIGTTNNPILGKITCGAFPREFHLSADGKTLYLTNYRSRTLQIMDADRLTELAQK